MSEKFPIGVCRWSFEQIAKRDPLIDEIDQLLLLLFVGVTETQDASEAVEGFAGREGSFGGRSCTFEKVDGCEWGGDLFPGSAPVAIEGSTVGVQSVGMLWVGSEDHKLVAEDSCVGGCVVDGGGFS